MQMFRVILVIVVASAVAMMHGGEAKHYKVGGRLGWTIPPGGARTYGRWVDQYTFKAHVDLLEFDFKVGEDDVIIVMEEHFNLCIKSDPLSRYDSPVSLGALPAGTVFFTSSFPGHCTKGQKMAVFFEHSSNSNTLPSSASFPSPSPSSSASSSNESVTIRHVPINVSILASRASLHA